MLNNKLFLDEIKQSRLSCNPSSDQSPLRSDWRQVDGIDKNDLEFVDLC